MSVNAELFVCGRYTVAYNSVGVGIFLGDDNVPTIAPRRLEEPIANTDRYGKTKVDAIHMGAAVTFSGVLMEYTRALPMLGILNFGLLGAIGTLIRATGLPLTLTATAGTPAATTPATITSNFAVLSPDFPVTLRFGPQLRTVPIQMDLYPYNVGSSPPVPMFFTTT